jgi:cytochrome c2
MRMLAPAFFFFALSACNDGPTVAWGDSSHGAAVIRKDSCGACHDIPGIRAARGVVGPPLERFSRRAYIAGFLPNTPSNLERWILDPKDVEPHTAMPKLGLTETEARDVAAYLFTLR